MPSEEDDKPTALVDISALKKKKDLQDNDISDMAGALEFGVGTRELINPKYKIPVLLYDFGQGFFDSNLTHLGTLFLYQNIKNLADLNLELKKNSPLIVMFYFDGNPKAANQLCAQLRIKFTHAQTVIVGKNLSDKKVTIHQNSPAAATGYISLPLEAEKVTLVLETIINKIAV